MSQILLIDTEISKALKSSKLIEETHQGDWVFFDASKGVQAYGIYQLKDKLENCKIDDATLLEVHDDFLKYLLGLFTPTLKNNVQIFKAENFKNFCIKINDLLKNKKTIFDHSRNDFWIWHESNTKNEITIGNQLKEFLEIT